MSYDAVILAAGKGTRMRSSLPKVMHKLANEPLLSHVLRTAQGAEKVVVVTAPDMHSVQQLASSCDITLQADRLGTGHAVQLAVAEHEFSAEFIAVLYGDTPLIQPETLEKLQKVMGADKAVGVLGFTVESYEAYGRLIANGSHLTGIVEYADANTMEREYPLGNAGIMMIRRSLATALLEKLDNQNAKNEYYLTDIVKHAVQSKYECTVLAVDRQEVIGINSRVELAAAEKLFQQQQRQKFLEKGVTLIDPDTVYFSADTQIAPDVIVEPNVYFGPNVSIAEHTTIRAFSHLEGVSIAKHCTVGPFARLRPGTELNDYVRIGDFVETKNSVFEAGSKANHLSYLGDAHIGAGANIGAGTITCNYDGFNKHKTVIGEGAFIGSNAALVAPVEIEQGALIAAGSVITQNVTANSIASTRPPQKQKQGAAKRFRDRIKQQTQ